MTPVSNNISKQRAVDRILDALSPRHIAQGSARIMLFGTAAATIYAITHGDLSAVVTISPLIARLIETVGANTLSGIIEKVAQDEDNKITPENIQQYIEEAFTKVQPVDYLSEKEFYHAQRILSKRDDDRHAEITTQNESLKTRLESIHELVIKTKRNLADSTSISYFDQITKLFKDASSDIPAFSNNKIVARNLTLTVLASADNNQKKEILRFLYESNLITHPSIVSLEDANLEGIDLSNSNLTNIDLCGANLREARLFRTDLSYARLNGTLLNDANLIEAFLQNCFLGATTNKRNADLRGANLSYADLSYAHLNPTEFSSLGGADCRKANFTKAKLIRADLTGASFKEAQMNGADLTLAFLCNKEYHNGANFSNADLRNANLTGAHITDEYLGSHALFTNSELRGANLKGVWLGTGFSLRDAIIDDTTLLDNKWRIMWEIVNKGAYARDLSGLDLSFLDLQRCTLELANLKGTNLKGTNLGGTSLFRALIDESTILERKWYTVWEIINNDRNNKDLSGYDLSYAFLSKANLSGANLLDANLEYSNLKGANLLGAMLNGANLHGVKLDTTTQIDSKWQLVWKIVNKGVNEENLDAVDLSEALLINAQMKKTSLKGSNLNGAVLKRANLEQAILDDAELSDTDFQDAKLGWAKLARANLKQSDMTSCDLRFAQLESANLEDVSLANAQMRGANLKFCNLSNAILEKADLKYAKLNEANLCGVDFTGADLENAEISGAKFDTNTTWTDNFNPRKLGAVEV